jgi:hypothetical protein
MNASVVINAKNEIAFIYGEPLGIEPAWATFDVEMKQLNIFNEESEERFLRLDEVQQEIYERIEKASQILLIQVKDNNITTPVKVDKVPLMVATQYSN